MTNAEAERLVVHGVELEIVRRGSGHPLLILHGFDTIDPDARFLDLLGRHAEIVAPSSPGFGRSPRPEDFDTVYDRVHLYLAALDALPGDKVSLLGFSFGGWLAAEVAAACCHRLAKLVLVDPVGIKISGRETPDILDVFLRLPEEVRHSSWHDPERFAPDYDALSDEALLVRARNREALCLYAWHPYMYNPQLPRWLGRITVPTLLVWGASDRVVMPDYGRAYSRLIPGSHFVLIETAGTIPRSSRPRHLSSRLRPSSRNSPESLDAGLVPLRKRLPVCAAGCARPGGLRARQPAQQILRPEDRRRPVRGMPRRAPALR